MSVDAERISSIAYEEFRRHLPLALRGQSWQWVDDGHVAIAARDCRLTVSVGELPPLRLSPALHLPRLRITFTFHDGDVASRTAFLSAWDRAFQRGGG